MRKTIRAELRLGGSTQLMDFFSPGHGMKDTCEGCGRVCTLIHSACPTKGFAFISAGLGSDQKGWCDSCSFPMEKLAVEGKWRLKMHCTFFFLNWTHNIKRSSKYESQGWEMALTGKVSVIKLDNLCFIPRTHIINKAS